MQAAVHESEQDAETALDAWAAGARRIARVRRQLTVSRIGKTQAPAPERIRGPREFEHSTSVIQMPDPVLSTLLIAVKALVPRVSARVKRLNAERKAGTEHSPAYLMDINLNETLNRLRGKHIDDSWWKNILHRIELAYIAPPSFLNNSTVQEWLADERVASDLKSLAKEIVMGGSGDHSETRARLKGSRLQEAAQDAQSGNDVIDDVVAILAAGYIASIPPRQVPVVGVLQESSSQMHPAL